MAGDVTQGYMKARSWTVQNLTVQGTLTTTGSITDNADLTLANGKAVQSDTTTGHTALLKAYDVDGAAYKTFLTLTNANTPSMAIAAPSGGSVTIDGAVIGGTTTAAGTFTTMTATTSVLGTATGGSVSVTGNVTAKSGTAVPASAGAVAAGAPITMFSGSNSIWVTSDAPSFSATKGDICINTGGSSSSTRLFINNGTTNWVAITTAS